MKKNLLPIITLLVLAFAGCKKDSGQAAPTSEVKQQVNFNVGDLEVSVTPINKGTKGTISTDSLRKYARYLYFRVYNSTGALVSFQDQTSTSATFGKVNLQLPAGSYTAVFAASASSLYMSNDYSTSLSSVYFYGSFSNNLSDTFFKRVAFTVTNQTVAQNVELNRIVSGINLTLTDPIPTNIAKIQILVASDPYGYYVGSDARIGNVTRDISFSLTAADKGVANKTFSNFVMKAGTPSNITIRAFDATNTLIIEKAVQNVPFYANKQTTISGKLFGTTSSNSSSFSVLVNEKWDTPPPVVTF
jgi:hypothetical protein